MNEKRNLAFESNESEEKKWEDWHRILLFLLFLQSYCYTQLIKNIVSRKYLLSIFSRLSATIARLLSPIQLYQNDRFSVVNI